MVGLLQIRTILRNSSTAANSSFSSVSGKYIFSGLCNTSGSSTASVNTNLNDELVCLHLSVEDLLAEVRVREAFNTPIYIISIIIFIFGVLANIVTIQAIRYIPKNQRTVHLKFITSLAFSDILMLLGIFSGDVIYNFSSLHPDCSKLFKTLLHDVPLLATLLHLLAMALDHYLASFRQLHYPYLMTRSRANCVICVIWVFSISAALTEIVIRLAARTKNIYDSFCMTTVRDSYSIEQVITCAIFFVLIVIIIIYIQIYSRVRKHLHRRPRMVRKSLSPSLKTFVTTMLFIGTFVLFWTPEGLFHIYMYMKSRTEPNYILEHRKTIPLVHDVLFLILQMNSLTNPIIYAVRLPKVKEGCRVIFCKKVYRSKYQKTYNWNRQITSV